MAMAVTFLFYTFNLGTLSTCRSEGSSQRPAPPGAGVWDALGALAFEYELPSSLSTYVGGEA